MGASRSRVDLDLVIAAPEHGRTAVRAGMASAKVPRIAFDRDRVLREDRRGIERGTMMLPAIEAVANSHAIGAAHRRDADFPAKATARNTIHDEHPVEDCSFTTSDPEGRRAALGTKATTQPALRSHPERPRAGRGRQPRR